MHRLRPYLAGFMLLLAAAIAMPRSWVHACENPWDEHLVHGDAGSQDQVSHPDCPFCDYAPVAAFHPAARFHFGAPGPAAPRHAMAVATPEQGWVPPPSQRGPPAA